MMRNSIIINRQSSIPNGFTLIEVMLVVVIILIVAGIAVPKFKGSFKSTQMTDATRSAVRIARYARSMSILKQEACVLRFETNRMVLVCGTNSASPEASRKIPDDVIIRSFENLSDESPASREGRTVKFYPAGMNDGFEITFEAGENRRATIVCNPISGKVSVEGDQ